MSDYIKKVFVESESKGGAESFDLDRFMSGLFYDNELRFVSNPFEFSKYKTVGVRASYSHRHGHDVHVDFFWGCRHQDSFPAGFPKDGIGNDGKAIWESCFCVTFLTPNAVQRGKAKKVILPTFANDAKVRCYVKSHMRSNSEASRRALSAFCSMSQLEALEAILSRFESTGDEDGVEFAATIPCEMVVQNG